MVTGKINIVQKTFVREHQSGKGETLHILKIWINKDLDPTKKQEPEYECSGMIFVPAAQYGESASVFCFSSPLKFVLFTWRPCVGYKMDYVGFVPSSSTV